MGGSRQLRLVLVLLVLTALTLTVVDYRAGGNSAFAPVRRGVDVVLGPAQRAVGGVARGVGSGLSGLLGRDGDSEEIERLRRENETLRSRLRQADEAARLSAELADLLNLKDLGTYTVVPARVAALGSAMGFEATATIDVGSKDGIRPDMTVVSGRGLVGRTTRVGPYTSTVLLVADRSFVAGVRLLRSAALGTVEGRGLGRMQYELFDQSQRLEAGDVVFTAGSETFVPGVPVGRITAVSADASVLTRTATVEPFVDVGSLDLVGVVVGGPRSTPRIPIPPARATASPGPASTPRASGSASPRSATSTRSTASPRPSASARPTSSP
ncbi:MAG TPA: rod shape-determining protein MreC [Mycobacteriales bacterium]|nr:rod shape-determining protein MreC [Mycobacteriales bacterium]